MVAYTDFFDSFANASVVDQFYSDTLLVTNMYVPLTKINTKARTQLLQYYSEKNIDVLSYVTAELQTFDALFKFISQILDVATLIMLLFVTMLIYNFMAVSIQNKQKDIGILRAMGAGGKDVSKVFFLEGAFICVLCLIFSVILIAVGCIAINVSLSRYFANTLSIVNFGIWPLIAVIITCISVVFVASALPLYRIIKMRPIDAIKRSN